MDQVPVDMIDADMSDSDNKILDMVIGDNMTSEEIQMLRTNLEGSPASSISGDDDVMSDLNDPVHEQQVLDELFFKQVCGTGFVSNLHDV